MFSKKQNTDVNPDFVLYTIYDTKVDAYQAPVLAVNDQDIIRQMSNQFQKNLYENKFFANAEDYSLFAIGAYDKKTGSLTSFPTPKHVVNFHEIRAAILAEQPALDEGLKATLRQTLREVIQENQMMPQVPPQLHQELRKQ
jgi:hypothetical protein